MKESGRSFSANVSGPFTCLPIESLSKWVLAAPELSHMNKHRVPVGSGSYTDLGGSDVCLALGVCWFDFLSNKPLSLDAVVPVVMLQVGGRES